MEVVSSKCPVTAFLLRCWHPRPPGCRGWRSPLSPNPPPREEARRRPRPVSTRGSGARGRAGVPEGPPLPSPAAGTWRMPASLVCPQTGPAVPRARPARGQGSLREQQGQVCDLPPRPSGAESPCARSGPRALLPPGSGGHSRRRSPPGPEGQTPGCPVWKARVCCCCVEIETFHLKIPEFSVLGQKLPQQVLFLPVTWPCRWVSPHLPDSRRPGLSPCLPEPPRLWM